MYRVSVDESIYKSLRKIPRNLQERLLRAAFGLEKNPRPSGVLKLQGTENLYRIRVGDFRIVYSIDDTKRIVEVTIIANRRDVYRGM